jgi:hypothetical protein
LVVGSIDEAAHVLQRRARTVVLGAAAFMVPMVAAGLALTVLVYRDFDRFGNLLGRRGYLGAETGAALVAISLQSFTAHLVGAYCAAFMVPYQMGGEPRLGQCILVVVRRLPLLLFTWVLTHGWAVLLALWMLHVSAAVAVALIWLLVPAVSLISTPVLLVAPAMMGERLGVRAIGRSLRLTRARFSAAWGFVILSTLLGIVVYLFIVELPYEIDNLGFVSFGSYGWLVQGVAAQVAGLVAMPLTALAAAQFYLQLRVHAEGVDLVIAADLAFGERP